MFVKSVMKIELFCEICFMSTVLGLFDHADENANVSRDATMLSKDTFGSVL